MKKNRAFLSSSFSLPDICLRTRIDEYLQNDPEGITWSSIVRLSWKDSVYRSKPRNKTKNVCARVCVCVQVEKKEGFPRLFAKERGSVEYAWLRERLVLARGWFLAELPVEVTAVVVEEVAEEEGEGKEPVSRALEARASLYGRVRPTRSAIYIEGLPARANGTGNGDKTGRRRIDGSEREWV